MALAVTLAPGQTLNGAGAAGPTIDFNVKIVASGSYVSGGDTLNLNGLVPGGSATKPISVDIQGQAGFLYKYKFGTKMSDGTMEVFIPTAVSGNSPFAEHSAAAYNAGVTGDTIIATVVVRAVAV